jgi:hypothetical protein
MEQNGALYCDECHLAIMRQPHRVVTREASPGKPARIIHFHNRETGDCWSKALAKARAAAPQQLNLNFQKDVIPSRVH